MFSEPLRNPRHQYLQPEVAGELQVEGGPFYHVTDSIDGSYHVTYATQTTPHLPLLAKSGNARETHLNAFIRHISLEVP